MTFADPTGESYTIAHHLFTADGERKIMIASLRYLDTFVKTGGTCQHLRDGHRPHDTELIIMSARYGAPGRCGRMST